MEREIPEELQEFIDNVFGSMYWTEDKRIAYANPVYHTRWEAFFGEFRNLEEDVYALTMYFRRRCQFYNDFLDSLQVAFSIRKIVTEELKLLPEEEAKRYQYLIDMGYYGTGF